MSNRLPSISIIIPVKNGGSWLNDLLHSIFAQSLIDDAEVIIIDSGSTDDSIDITSRFGVRLIQISPTEFNHGETRNVGVRAAKGKYVVMTVQDAMPENERWLETLVKPLADEEVAGVCGQQIVSHDSDKNPVQWWRPRSKPVSRRVKFDHAHDFDTLTPDEKKELCRWDNVTAAYQRDALLNLPFQQVSFAEDALWARDALRAGYAIVYEPRARVKHYHIENVEYTFKRVFTVSYHYYMAFGAKPKLVENGPFLLLRNARTLLFSPGVSVFNKLKWLYFNLAQRRAINRAVMLFHQSLISGEDNLERKHLELCGKPPQAVESKAPGRW